MIKIPPGYYIIAAIAVIIIVSVLLLLNGEEIDDTAPTLSVLTQNNISVPVGNDAIIKVNYSDNIEVTSATVYFKAVNDSIWSNTSILNSNMTARIPIPSTAQVNYEYYVTVDDAAGNGPIRDPVSNNSFYTITVLTEFNQNKTIQHPVFIEKCTSRTCKPCVSVGEILHNLYENDEYPLYYVSLVDQETNAEERLDSFNLYGFPTVVFDGGYTVLDLAQSEENYTAALQQSLSRNAPGITVNITAEMLDNDITFDVLLKNYDDTAYSGTLKVYITEIKSTRHRNYDNEPYDYCFVDYAYNKAVSISAKSSDEITNVSLDLPEDLDATNIMLFAVVFGDEKHQAYAHASTENPFDAYYADTVNTTRIIEGNLPPTVGITSLTQGKVHIFGRTVLNSLSFNNTILLGRTTISVDAVDPEGGGIEKVEFYLDGELVDTQNSAPFEWLYKTPSILRPRHTIAVKAYDTEGATSTDEREIIAFILL